MTAKGTPTPTAIGENLDQLLPSLAAGEYECLKADIAKNGVMVEVVFDSEGRLIDGHHRVRASRELGLPDPPKRVVDCKSDVERQCLVLRLNLNRRHLSPEQVAEVRKRQQGLAVELRNKGKAQAEIAEMLGVSQPTIARWVDPGNIIHVNNVSDRRLVIPRDQHEVIVQRANAKEHIKAIAADFKVTEKRISQIVKRANAAPQKSRPSPEQTYGTIVIEPSWPTETAKASGHAAAKSVTAGLRRIGKLPVRDFTGRADADVFLSLPQRFLRDGLRLFDKWKIKFERVLVRVKATNPGAASGIEDTELVLVGRHGDLGVKGSVIPTVLIEQQSTGGVASKTYLEVIRDASPEPRVMISDKTEVPEGFTAWQPPQKPPARTKRTGRGGGGKRAKTALKGSKTSHSDAADVPQAAVVETPKPAA